MKTRFSILLVVLSFFVISGCNNNGSNNISEELRQLIDDIVKCTMLEKQLPGLAVSVVKNGDVIYQDSFGKTNIAAGDDVEVDTPFAIASMTKIFTTFSVMQLIEDGLVTLDDPIGMHLPNLPNEQWKTRSIRNLLSMSSGIPELAFCKDGPKKGEVCEDNTRFKFNLCGEGFKCEGANRVPYEQFLEGAAQIPLQFDGGAEYFYSNSNFIILGELVEALSGSEYKTYLKDNVLIPLGMDNTRPNTVPPPSIPGLALGYKHITENPGPDAFNCISFEEPPTNCKSGPPAGVKCEAIPVDDLRLPDQSFSAGWLVTTQPDMVKLEKALHDLSPTLLNFPSYEEMWTNTQLTDGSFERFGLGWGVCSELNDSFCPIALDLLSGGINSSNPKTEATGQDGKIVYKDGGLPGYGSIIVRYLDDGLTVVVFVNTSPVHEGDLKFAPLDLAAEIALTIRDN
ncbi:MAG: hypothetical protein DHS20C13_19880 [Thermodesulfobacteriota bacterium]|nr:MAG: hypothetical protein DHS20C13_19880 [Thermodesulfobacteriota bacterium]